MKINVDKKAIQAAIDAELKKEQLTEAPLDVVKRAAGGVSNMFSNIGGQVKLGSINTQLKTVAKRIDKDWNDAEDVVTKLANKMSASRNPNVKQKAAAVSQNLASASSDIRNATQKLKNMGELGADSSQGGPQDDLAPKTVTDKYGFKSTQSAVDRWIQSFGGDLDKMSRPEQGKLQKMFFDLLSAGIDPFKVPKDKQEMLRQYHNYRMAEIADNGSDPYPNYEHFEKVLGPQVAEKMRSGDQGLQSNKVAKEKSDLKARIGTEPADQTRMAKSEPQQASVNVNAPPVKSNKQAVAAAIAAASGEQTGPVSPPEQPNQQATKVQAQDEYSKLASSISPQLKSDIDAVYKKAKQSGVKKDMIGKYLVSQLPGPNKFMDQADQAFLKKLRDKFEPQAPEQPKNSFGGGDFNPPHQPQGPNWERVKQSKKIDLPPVAQGPAKKVLPPNQSISSFFDDGETQNPNQIPSAIEKPPVQNFDNEIQVGSEESPAMMPKNLMMPKSLSLKKASAPVKKKASKPKKKSN